MAWHASGEERLKSYKAYKELEKKLKDAEDRMKDLELELQAKDKTMQQVISVFSHAMSAMRVTERPASANGWQNANKNPSTDGQGV